MNQNEWAQLASKHLKGKVIKEVRYLTTEEAENIGWDYRCLVIILSNGEYIFPSSDDEGNQAGALFTSFEDLPTIPVMR